MAKDLLEIAEKIYGNHYKGKNLIAETSPGYAISKAPLYQYNNQLGIWQEHDETIIMSILVREFEKRRRSEISDSMDLIKMIASEHFVVDGKTFNHNKNKIVLQNGVFDLTTKDLTKFDPKLYATANMMFDYNPKATCPLFEEFMNTIFEGEREMIDYMLETLGYLFFPTTAYEAIFVWIGEGSNGKSTLAKVLKSMLGKDFYSDVRIEDLNQPTNLLRMRNKLVNFASETPEGSKRFVLDTGHLKNISSGEEVTAKAMYKNPIEYVPYARQIILCNTMPVIRDTSKGWTRRLHLIPFNYIVPEKDRIPDLDVALFKEASGIFNLVMGAFERTVKRGRFILPERVQMAVKKHQVEINSAAAYVLSQYDFELGEEESYKEFFEEYITWCKDRNMFPYGRKSFWQNITRFFTSEKDLCIEPHKYRGTGNILFVKFTMKENSSYQEKKEEILKYINDID